MRLKVFDTIDETLQLLEQNNTLYHTAENDIEDYLMDLLEQQDMIVDINSRVKSKESLREKIIRNRFYAEN
ncbi:MAG: RelA/spoT family protein, partial [Longicatena sp.]